MHRRGHLVSLFTLVFLFVLPLLTLAHAVNLGILTSRISVASNGTEGNAISYRGRMTNDGRWVLFTSFADNLVAGDTNGRQDVFLHDRFTSTTQRVSLSSTGSQANHESISGDISATGIYVTFISTATNLVSNDTNGVSDVFFRNLQTGTTERVSVSSSETQANSGAVNQQSGVSADGRWVVFSGTATNLVTGDTNATSDIFLRDRLNGTTSRISVSSSGVQANGASGYPGISDDGRFVIYDSVASNLVAGDSNGDSDIFLYDRLSGTTSRVSVTSGGAQGNGASRLAKISSSGEYVVFESDATNLVPGDTNDRRDVFLYERTSGTVELVSVNSDGIAGNQVSQLANVNAAGRYIVFRSDATNLVANDTNARTDTFLHDRNTHQTTRISVATDGTQANGTSWFSPEISSDGTLVAFDSDASNLVEGDNNFVCDIDGNGTFEENCIDVFVREWLVLPATPTPGTPLPPTNTPTAPSNPTSTPSSTPLATATILPTSTPSPTTPPASNRLLFLPLVAQRYQPLVCLASEIEPNNASVSAFQYPPLCQNLILTGSLPADDPGDYYRLVLTAPGVVTIDLFGIAIGTDFDLYLYDEALVELAVSRTDGNADERIGGLALLTGTYYVRIYPDPTEMGGDRTYRLRWMR